ncbi:U7 snRNA-associated Sm-like protein LSm10 [Chrysoperla carnea]|uniref:U7 snRNA-associated Sm-like protein LSm10 n=1 Tax=Chrysoperla carnea TaxID=189513 RepID=UPI001D078C04|nr:U7 snRNA-associated Sm-like protein LSm10 [Chrysoperla carnea]
MANRGSKRERFYFFNNLSGLVKSLEKKYILIDLRNDLAVDGRIIHVDGFSNVTMEDAILIDTLGQQTYFEEFFIHARNIRYVHLPEDINVNEQLESLLKQLTYRMPRENTKVTNRKIRALQKHRETVQNLRHK